jgi:hypothetical protein
VNSGDRPKACISTSWLISPVNLTVETERAVN